MNRLRHNRMHAVAADHRPFAASLRDAAPVPYWLDRPDAPAPRPVLTATAECDLAVVGAGFTGLWTALLALERDPGADVVVLEAGAAGGQASGRNGGFCMSTLTHGVGRGLDAYPGDMPRLEELARQNLQGMEEAVARYGIDCHWERTGELLAAARPWEVDGLREEAAAFDRVGRPYVWMDGEAVRSEVASPLYLAGLWDTDGCVMVDPAALAWGVARAAEGLGARLFEHTPVIDLQPDGAAVRLRTPYADVRAQRVVLATNAFPPLLRRLRRSCVPVWDYALVSEPLTPAQRECIGWRRRQGLADAGSQFHYFRLTADDRILWGGWDAEYYFGSAVSCELEQRPATFARLAAHFFHTFPQLDGLRFTHAWGGVIDTCSRFFQFFGTAHGGRVAYVLGFTGMGVGASRFAADVVLDLLTGEPTERTRLEMVRTRPLPFPPEPFRWPLITVTRQAIARADRTGERNGWLRLLDRFGLGFDS